MCGQRQLRFTFGPMRYITLPIDIISCTLTNLVILHWSVLCALAVQFVRIFSTLGALQFTCWILETNLERVSYQNGSHVRSLGFTWDSRQSFLRIPFGFPWGFFRTPLGSRFSKSVSYSVYRSDGGATLSLSHKMLKNSRGTYERCARDDAEKLSSRAI